MCVMQLPEVDNATISQECIAKNAGSVAMRMNKAYLEQNASIVCDRSRRSGEDRSYVWDCHVVVGGSNTDNVDQLLQT